MRIKRRVILTAGMGALLASKFSLASTYPDRPITFICPWPAGGTADATMRALCSAASKVLGQPVALENRAGAAGMIGLKSMTSARPDGYTIGQIPISVTRFSQLGKVQIDPFKDICYLARTSGQTFGIAVRVDSPFKTLGEMVAAAKNAPGKLTYGSSGIGGATHVGMEEFTAAAGISLNHIAYKGGAPALQDTLAGHVDMLADSSSWAPHVKAGKMRLLATWGEKRTSEFPNVPTLRDEGFDVIVDAPNGIGAPKGLDPSIERHLRDAFRLAVQSAEFKSACDKIDAPVMYLDGPDYEKYVTSVYRKETQLIQRLKLRELMDKGRQCYKRFAQVVHNNFQNQFSTSTLLSMKRVYINLLLWVCAMFGVSLLAGCANYSDLTTGAIAQGGLRPMVKAASANPPRSILYVGNSFMYYNNSLHTMVSLLARNSLNGESAAHRSTSLTISGSGLDWHDIQSYLRPDGLGRYSFVGDNEVRFNPPGQQYDSAILMDCSQCPVHPTLSKIFFEYAKKHSTTARSHGVEPMFLMTWAYADKPEMTKGLAKAYDKAGQENNAHVIPAGLAFAASIASRPDINLYVSDKRHPSLAGSYLAAATLVASVWNVNPVGSKFLAGLSPDVARHLQEIAWETTRKYHGRS